MTIPTIMDWPGKSPVVAIRGQVEQGDRRGRTLGFPTANIAVSQDHSLDGVWAGCATIDEQCFGAAISIGRRPTFYDQSGFRLLEAHLLDFSDDIYGRILTVIVGPHLRDQVKFDSVRELVVQLERDVENSRQWFEGVSRSIDLVGIETQLRVHPSALVPFGVPLPLRSSTQ